MKPTIGPWPVTTRPSRPRCPGRAAPPATVDGYQRAPALRNNGEYNGGPVVVTVSGSDAAFEVSRDCVFVRQERISAAQGGASSPHR